MQETRYKIIRIDEEDYGCEERPDDYVPMVSVLVKAIEPDDFGDFPERIIMMEDEITLTFSLHRRILTRI